MKLPNHFPKIEIRTLVALAFAAGIGTSLAVALLVYAFNSGPLTMADSSAPAENQMVENSVAPQQPLKIIDGTQQDARACEGQAWPYIDQKCLTPDSPRQRAVATPKTAPTATTDGMASVSDRTTGVVGESTWKAVTTTLPDRPNAVTGEQRFLPVGNAQANAEPQKPEQTASVDASQASEPARRRKAHDSRPSREGAASVKSGDPNRIVRRWREVEYERAK
jgi:hypothetical protein